MKKVVILHGYNGIPLVFEWLKEKLEEKNYNVLMPTFPKQEGCRYDAWSNILDEHKDFFNNETIVVAHSIGNAFTFKYLSKNNIKIKLYIGLAGFCDAFSHADREDLNEAVESFSVSQNEIEKFKTITRYRYSIYSDNDHIVPFKILEECPKKIGSNSILIKNIGHMGKKSGLKELPEIINIIDKY